MSAAFVGAPIRQRQSGQTLLSPVAEYPVQGRPLRETLEVFLSDSAVLWTDELAAHFRQRDLFAWAAPVTGTAADRHKLSDSPEAIRASRADVLAMAVLEDSAVFSPL